MFDQRPPEPKLSGDIASYLSSYMHLEDTGPQPEPRALEARAAREAYLRNRVAYLRSIGRMSRLDDEEAFSSSKSKPAGSNRSQDHQDFMMAHMTSVRNAMMNEAKSKPVVCKRLARMVMNYWEMEEGREERERLAEEREQKRKVKDLARAIRKKWSLAVKVRQGMRSKLISGRPSENPGCAEA